MENQAKKLNLENEQDYYDNGNTLFQLGKYEEAIEMYTRAIELNPNVEYYYENKGHSLLKLKKYQEALKMFTRAIELNPNNGSYFYHKGHLLIQLNKNEEALEMYTRAIELNPNDEAFYNSKGHLLEQLGQYNEAIEMYNNAIELNPYQGNYYFNKGNCLVVLGRNEEALEMYNRATELNPKNQLLYSDNKAVSLKNLHRYEEAINLFDWIIEMNPQNVQAYHNKGLTLKQLGKDEEAINMFNCAIELNPQYILAYANKSILLNKLGRSQEARECIQMCSKLLKDAYPNNLTQYNIDYIYNLIAQFEIIEKENVKIMEKVDTIVGKKTEKQSLQSVAKKFTNLIAKITQQQVVEKIGSTLNKEKNEDNIQKNESNNLNQIADQQKLINDKLADQNKTLLEKQQYLEEMLKKMEDKLNKQEKQMQNLNKNVEQINNDLNDGGVKQKAELNRDLQKLKETEEDSVFNYYKTFYWTSMNVFQTYRIISTNLVEGNYKSDANDFLIKNGDKVKDGMKICMEAGKEICKGVISSVPIVGNIFNFIDKTISAVVSAAQAYSDKKHEIKFQNKVNAINQVISARFQTDEHLSIKLGFLAIRLTKFRKDAINFPPQKQIKKGSVMSWLSDQISKVEQSNFNKTELHDLNNEGVKLALQDVVLLISFISLYSDKIIKMQKSDIVDVLADIVEKQLEGLLAIEIKDSKQPETQQGKKTAPTTEKLNNECQLIKLYLLYKQLSHLKRDIKLIRQRYKKPERRKSRIQT